MSKSCIGIDIGSSEIKLASCSNGHVNKLLSAPMPDNMLNNGVIISPEAMSEFLKQTISHARLGTRNCAVVLPAALAFTRNLQIPLMTEEQLKLNLPYEFRDYITQEKDKYVYDYAVISHLHDENGNLSQLELVGAAALKETIETYTDICRKAGLKLVAAAPEEIAYMNLVKHLEAHGNQNEGRDYCFLDLGHSATHMHIYKGLSLEATRLIEIGVGRLDSIIAEQYSVDEHLAREYKHANQNNELDAEECRAVYSSISLEVVRVLNFYRFNNPDSELKQVYVCGGGSNIAPLMQTLSAELGLQVITIDTVLPSCGANIEKLSVCQAAIGITLD